MIEASFYFILQTLKEIIIYLDFVFGHENDSATLLSGNITLKTCPLSSQELLEYFDQTTFNAQQIYALVTELNLMNFF